MLVPKVSIVICTYNGEKFLRQQLESLSSQTYPNLEILISDDGSKDNTLAIAREFAASDSRFRIHVNQHNLGYNKNFEQAFHLATGELIAACDQDDYWKKDKVEKMVPLFTGEEILLVHSQSVRFREDIPEIEEYTRRRFFKGSDVRKVLYYNTIAGHNIIFRKRLLRYASPFPANVFYDWWLVVVAAAHGAINGTSKVYTFHRWHTSNITLSKKDDKTQTPVTIQDRFNVLSAALHLPGLKTSDREFASELLKAHCTLKGRKFSFTLFRFLLLHGSTVLYFKKKIWSRAKMAFRQSICKI